MDTIFYAGGAVTTGTAIAKALMDYAEELATVNTAATVDIPILLENGSIGRSTFLIGPASQVISETASSDQEEIVDDALVESFRAETRALKQTQNHRVASEEQTPQVREMDWIDDV